MMQTILALLMLLGLSSSGAAPAAANSQDDPRQLLAAARQAMGGEKALAAVRSFQVSGNAERDLGFAVADQAIEIACRLPDRFVRRASYNSVFGGPLSVWSITTHRDGFAGSDLIRETTTEGDFVPTSPAVPRGPAPTPDQEAAIRRDRLLGQQRIFARLALVLFAESRPCYPLQFSSAGRVVLPDGKTADAVDATGPDGAVMRLFIDDVSHLPVMLTWHERAVVVSAPTASAMIAVQSIAVVPSGTVQPGASRPAVVPPPPPLAAGKQAIPPGAVPADRVSPGDPRSIPLFEHAWTIGAYRVADGLCWPHRLTERVDGRVLEDLKLRNFKLNGKIADSKFKIAKPDKE